MIPTCIATRGSPSSSGRGGPAVPSKPSGLGSGHLASKRGIEDLDFFIGDEALANNKTYSVQYPIRHGQIEDWDQMERYWEQSIFKYLRAEPEDHHVLLVSLTLSSSFFFPCVRSTHLVRTTRPAQNRALTPVVCVWQTEPPLNPPENREATAEIMFESFNVQGLYIAVQAVLALAASWSSAKVTDRTLTGTVIDSGDGVTHIIPVVGLSRPSFSCFFLRYFVNVHLLFQAEGYVIGSAIRHIPIAGRDISSFVQQLLRDRNETGIPPEDSLRVAEKIKEDFSYVCGDMVKEFSKYDKEPSKYFGVYEGEHSVTGKVRGQHPKSVIHLLISRIPTEI